MQRTNGVFGIYLVIGIILDVWLWYGMFSPHPVGAYFLDVGQGDSTFLALPDTTRVLIDAGPDVRARRALDDICGSDRHIDFVVVTHPQLDHFGGLRDIVRRYRIGAVLISGREADDAGIGSAWTALLEELSQRSIPIIRMHAGGLVRTSSGTWTVLSPDASLVRSGELNDTGIVLKYEGADAPWRILLPADISRSVEQKLITEWGERLRADVLKLGHHGSKYSTGEAFLSVVDPDVVIISAGTGNRYGHPSPDTLERLRHLAPGSIVRTDQRGTIRVRWEAGRLLLQSSR